MTRAAGAEIAADEPITLTEASRVILRGVVTVSALRSEIRRGNLAVERIGKNLYTTPAAIREMRDKCRVMPNRPDSTSEKTAIDTSGLSATGTGTDELALLRKSVGALKNGSLNTSSRSTRRDQQKAGSPIPFPLRKS